MPIHTTACTTCTGPTVYESGPCDMTHNRNCTPCGQSVPLGANFTHSLSLSVTSTHKHTHISLSLRAVAHINFLPYFADNRQTYTPHFHSVHDVHRPHGLRKRALRYGAQPRVQAMRAVGAAGSKLHRVQYGREHVHKVHRRQLSQQRQMLAYVSFLPYVQRVCAPDGEFSFSPHREWRGFAEN